ncbi:hypothetical protein [Sphingomonas sp. PAMC 26605]|nr:hypothetical protein [Sphingomonas sp. PAMC 26605]
MLDQKTRTRNWLADLASFTAEVEAQEMPALAHRLDSKRTRKRKPPWEK